MIDRKMLEEIEDAIGFGCQVYVTANHRDYGLAVGAVVHSTDKEVYSCEELISVSQMLSGEIDQIIERFQVWAKREIGQAIEDGKIKT